MIANKASKSIERAVNSLTISPVESNKNPFAAAFSSKIASLNPATSVNSKTTSFAATSIVPVVVDVLSSGSTMKLIVIFSVNAPSVTVNVIGNTPPVSATAFNASNCASTVVFVVVTVTPLTKSPAASTINPFNSAEVIALSNVYPAASAYGTTT